MFMVVFRGLFQFKVMLYSLNVRCRRVSTSLCVFFLFLGIASISFLACPFLGWLAWGPHTYVDSEICVCQFT